MTHELDVRPVAFSGAAAQGPGTGDRGLPELVSEAYSQAPLTVRARLLEHLLRPVGPLALVALAAGAFGHLMFRLGRNAVPVSVEDAARISAEHVLELARYVEQSSPALLAQIAPVIQDRGSSMARLSGSALLLAMGAWGYHAASQGAAAPR